MTSGKLQLANMFVFAGLFAFIYFDLAVVGVGICFTLSGLLSIVAFIYNTDPLWMSTSSEIIFGWLFEIYSKRAMNLVYASISMIIGIVALVAEFG